jgi:hypothetical protein
MSLRSGFWALGALALASFAAAAPAQAAPQQLLGKSIVISFIENRVQRNGSALEFRPLRFSGEISVYISSAGRTFSRLHLTNPRSESGKADRVGNSSAGVTSFAGNTMTMLAGGAGGARRTVVTFGAGFTTCEASMVRAKPAGQSMIRTGSIIHPGLTVEIRSVEITGISCRIRDGNVFGGA